MPRINIAFGFTVNWAKYAASSIASILSNAKDSDEYHFYLMSDMFSANDKEMFNGLSKIKKSEFNFIKMDNSEFDGAIHDWLGVSSSYRLKLSSLVNEDKILYLDSDIMAREDIAPLYSYDVSDYYLGMVEDKCSYSMKVRVGLKGDDTFFNGGLQLINLKKFREDDLEKIIFKKLRASDFYTDQDVINDVCRNKILSLPLRYNIVPLAVKQYKNREKERDKAIANPALVHFSLKPWTNPETPFADEWRKYYQEATGEQLDF